jgi:hypothetical protein
VWRGREKYVYHDYNNMAMFYDATMREEGGKRKC